MAENDRFSILTRSGGATDTRVEYDQGVRSFMLGIYNYMALGVALTGVVAFGFSQFLQANPQIAQAIYGGPIKWVLALAPLAFVMVISFGVQRMSLATTQLVFWAFAAVMGLSISHIFLMFTGASIAQIFFVTAIAFGSLSIWGYTTKRDLSGLGKFLFMGLIGVVAASLINIFVQSSALQFAASVIGVLVFAGLTAYDNQRLRHMYYEIQGTEFVGKAAVMGALSLYLNFINMFMLLLNLFGQRE